MFIVILCDALFPVILRNVLFVVSLRNALFVVILCNVVFLVILCNVLFLVILLCFLGCTLCFLATLRLSFLVTFFLPLPPRGFFFDCQERNWSIVCCRDELLNLLRLDSWRFGVHHLP